jgi:hypothetical protein
MKIEVSTKAIEFVIHFGTVKQFKQNSGHIINLLISRN